MDERQMNESLHERNSYRIRETPYEVPHDMGHPATNWNSSVAAEARLSIIETWPDRQKIQKGGKDAPGCCLAENPFPLFSTEVKTFRGMIRPGPCIRYYLTIYARYLSISPWMENALKNGTGSEKFHPGELNAKTDP